MMIKKKNFILTLIIIIIFNCAYLTKAKAITIDNKDAEAIMLMDAKTGRILYSKNPNKQLAPASTTKILTALLVLEHSNLNDMVTIGENPATAEGTSIALQKGDVYSVNDLLHGMLLESANDCAIALAEYIGGSVQNFAKMMNEKARSLGANSSNFVNPNGLYEKDHFTTAYDLALIMRKVSENADFVKITREPFYKLPASKVDKKEKWVNNKNKMVLTNNHFFYNYALTGKTGFTTPSLHTYAAVAEKNGEKLILTILKSPSKDIYFKDAKDLFEYGFNNFTTVKIYNKGDKIYNYNFKNKKEIKPVPLTASENFYYTFNNNYLHKNELSRGEKTKVTPKIVLENININPNQLSVGQKVAEGKIILSNKEIGTIGLCSSVNSSYLKPKSFFESNKNIIIISLIIGVVILLIGLVSFKLFKISRKHTKH